MSIFFLLVIVIWLWIGNLFYNAVLNRNKINDKNFPFFKEDDFFRLKRETMKQFQILKSTYGFQEVWVKSQDKLKLHAYHIYQPSSLWVIISHGYLSSGKSMAILASFYAKKGYNVLLVDARAHGRSQGTTISMGYKESMDIRTWILWIVNQFPKASIVLHGITMGASATLMATQKTVPKNVKALVADSAYTSAYDLLYYHLQDRVGILSYPILWSISFITRIRSDFSIKDSNVLNTIHQNKVPVLYFYGKEDEWIPPIMTEILFQNTKAEKWHHLFKAKHGLAQLDEEYYVYLKDFLDRYMEREND